mgnify:CR=1 FL=1
MEHDPSGQARGQAFCENRYPSPIKSGTGIHASPVTIQNNNGTTLNLASALAVAPSIDSLYFIVRQQTFTLLSEDPNDLTNLTLRHLITGSASHSLARNVTQLVFDQSLPCTATSVCITLSTRSQKKDPRTGKYRTYTLTSSATPRN